MRDKKALKDLLALDNEMLDSIAPKPFKACCLSAILSVLAPHYYSQEQLAQIKNFCEQCADAVVPVEAENSTVVNAERSPQSHNNEEKEERIINITRVTKKPRSKSIKKRAAARKRRRQSDEEGVAIVRNRVSKKSKNATPSSSRYIIDPSTSNLSPNTAPSPPNTLPSFSSPSNALPQDLPIEFQSKIMELNGTDIAFVMRKNIYTTDLHRNNDRLSMPISQLKCDFLSEAEKVELDRRDKKNNILGIEVTVFDPCLREFTLKLKKWDMRASSNYNLASHWIEVAQRNNLQPNNKLDIWSFRVQDKRYFMLHQLDLNIEN